MTRFIAGICLFAVTAAPLSCSSPGGGASDAGAGYDGATPPSSDVAAVPPSNDAATPPSSDAAMPTANAASAEAGEPICVSEWPQTDWLLVSGMAQATDSAGNTYVALNYDDNRPLDDDAGQPPRLNLGSPSPQFPAGFAVAKFDDGCHLVWVREFGPSGAAYSYGAEAVAIAIDSDSNVTILGDFFGSVDFGAGTLTSGPQIDNGVLLRLDETGKTVFSRQFVNTRSGSSTTVYDLAVTPAGISTVAVNADSDTDFGNGPSAGLFGPQSTFYLVQYDTSGNVVFQEPVTTIDSSIWVIYTVATNASGFLWTTGVYASLFSPTVQESTPFTIGVTSSGALAWQKSGVAGGLAAGPNGAVELRYPSGAPTSEILQAFASDGSSPWTVSTPMSTNGGGGLVIDSSGEPLVVGSFQGTVTYGSMAPLTSAGGLDIDYEVFDTTGHLVTAGEWGGKDDDIAGGIGTDPAGNILMTGSSVPAMADATSRVFFVKLAP